MRQEFLPDVAAQWSRKFIVVCVGIFLSSDELNFSRSFKRYCTSAGFYSRTEYTGVRNSIVVSTPS